VKGGRKIQTDVRGRMSARPEEAEEGGKSERLKEEIGNN
jgi:hypothetical protein